MAFCSSCGAPVAETSALCPECANQSEGTVSGQTASVPASHWLNDSLAGVICYLPIGPIGVIASIVFLFLEPYRRNRFVRFHAIQSLMLAVFCAVLFGSLLAFSVLFVGILSTLAIVLFLVFPLLALAIAITTIVLMIKANTGEAFRLPLIGDFAARRADAI